MKTIITGALFTLLTTGLAAQNGHMNGNWDVVKSAYHYADPFMKIRVNSSANTVNILNLDGSGVPNGAVLKADVKSTMINFFITMDEAGGDTLRSYSVNALSVGNPDYLYGYMNSFKNPSALSEASFNCFVDEDCFFDNENVWLRKTPLRVVEEDQIVIGAQSQDFLQLEEVRFTDDAIEVLLFFETGEDNYAGTLHGPGSTNTFFLRDVQGNRYELLSQAGWPGPDQGGFGSYTIPGGLEEDEMIHVILYFEPATNYRLMGGFSLLEGSCASGCWNFFEVRLND